MKNLEKCEYCYPNRGIPSLDSSNDNYIYIEDGKMVVVIKKDGKTIVSKHKIDYCPICGREL